MTDVSEIGRDLAASLTLAFAEGIPSWLPGFAPALAQLRWDRLQASCGITPQTYGTARIRASDVRAERDLASSVPLPAAFGRTGNLLLETLRSGPGARYTDLGLDLAPHEVVRSSKIASRVRAGLETIASVPSLSASVGSVLHVLHVALPEGPDYDVSYSDPEVPFSIFVGVSPEGGGDRVEDLRLAEGILHEAMHLQLTLVEEVLPLIVDEMVSHYSPWQSTMRPARGILHGIYVFAVIRDLMKAVLDDRSSDDAQRRHASERIDTASSEIEDAAGALLAGSSLSTAGIGLVRGLVGTRISPSRRTARIG